MFLLLRAVILIMLLSAPVAVGVTAAALAASLTSPMRGSVGDRGVNARADVAYVQFLLNDWLGAQGLQLIGFDGILGAETVRAITGFQQALTGVADGRFDANGPGIRALETAHLTAIDNAGLSAFEELLGVTGESDDEQIINEPGDVDGEPAEEITVVDVPILLPQVAQEYFDASYDTADVLVGA